MKKTEQSKPNLIERCVDFIWLCVIYLAMMFALFICFGGWGHIQCWLFGPPPTQDNYQEALDDEERNINFDHYRQ